MLDKEILDEFKNETNQLMTELTEVVEKLEIKTDSFPTELLQEFSQKIDRVMGTAKTLMMMDEGNADLQRVADIADLCKRLGYKAAESQSNMLIPLFAGFWADTIEVLGDLVNHLDDPEKSEALAKSFFSILMGRLQWLSTKVTGKGLPPSSTKPALGEATDQMDVDDLLKAFGLG